MKTVADYLREGASDDFMAKVESAPAGRAIFRTCMAICEFLLDKNQAYGNSALEPLRCFSKASALEQIKVRLDDKLSRLVRGELAGEDVAQDLLGYLVLLTLCEHGVYDTLQDRRREDGDRGLRDRGPERARGRPEAPQGAAGPHTSGLHGERTGADRSGRGPEEMTSRMEARLHARHEAKVRDVVLPSAGFCQDCNAPLSDASKAVCEACVTRKGFQRFEGPPVERSSELPLKQ